MSTKASSVVVMLPLLLIVAAQPAWAAEGEICTSPPAPAQDVKLSHTVGCVVCAGGAAAAGAAGADAADGYCE